MSGLKIGLLIAGLGSGIAPAICFAAGPPTQGVPVAVQHAIDEMGKACAAWPTTFDTEKAGSAHPAPIDFAELQDRGLCSDVASASNSTSSRDGAIVFLIMAVGFFALLGLFVTLAYFWRNLRSLVWWIKRANLPSAIRN